MALPIYVDAHSGYKSNERPGQFELDDELYEIVAVEEQWRSPRGVPEAVFAALFCQSRRWRIGLSVAP